jgi:hypothetical protein
VLRFGIGPLAATAPCRVVAVIDEDRRRGFAYGTLPGHPEQGEEAFLIHHATDGAVTLDITAFSRPSSLATRLLRPLARTAQRHITNRERSATLLSSTQGRPASPGRRPRHASCAHCRVAGMTGATRQRCSAAVVYCRSQV